MLSSATLWRKARSGGPSPIANRAPEAIGRLAERSHLTIGVLFGLLKKSEGRGLDGLLTIYQETPSIFPKGSPCILLNVPRVWGADFGFGAL